MLLVEPFVDFAVADGVLQQDSALEFPSYESYTSDRTFVTNFQMIVPSFYIVVKYIENVYGHQKLSRRLIRKLSSFRILDSPLFFCSPHRKRNFFRILNFVFRTFLPSQFMMVRF